MCKTSMQKEQNSYDYPLELIMDDWLTTHKSYVKESTLSTYITMMNKHLKPFWGGYYLSQIDKKTIHQFFDICYANKLSGKYINQLISLLKLAVSSYINANDIEYTFPNYKPPVHRIYEAEIFTREEWFKLVDYINTDKSLFSLGLKICMFTGIRVGELAGLRWADIDDYELHISHTVLRIKNTDDSTPSKTKVIFTSPKSSSSIRSIPLPAILSKELFSWRSSPEYFILTNSHYHTEPRNIQRRYERLLKKLGIKHHTFHALRHSFASYGIQSGVDYKTMSKILGHSSPNITMNYYIHCDKEYMKACMEKIWEHNNSR